MKLSSSRRGKHHLITVNADRIDAATAIAFKKVLRAASADHRGDVLRDLGQVHERDNRAGPQGCDIDILDAGAPRS